MLQSLKSKVVKYHQKTLSSQSIVSVMQIKWCPAYAQVHAETHTTQHVSGLFTVITYKRPHSDWAQRGWFEGSMVVKVKICKIPKTQGRVILSSTGSLRFSSSNPTTTLYDRNYFLHSLFSFT